MLTNAAARAAGALTRAYKIHDQGGMHLLVRPSGTKSWQQKYRWKGREKLYTIGRFPDLNVIQARMRQAEVKDMLERGIDPSGASAQAEQSFEALARRWHRLQASNWSGAHARDVLKTLERYIFPEIGAREVHSVMPRELLTLVRRIEQRGHMETAGRVRQRLSAIFGFAVAEGLREDDPAAQLGRAMTRGQLSVPHAALTEIEDCRALLRACQSDGARIETVLASSFLAHTAVRLDALRGARWSEIDLDARIWTVPAARMKLSRAKKSDSRFDHLVPLSRGALSILQDVRSARHHDWSPDGLIFPGRDGHSPIAPGAIREMYARTVFAGRHVPHGWRASFSTILNENMGEEWRGDIDRALAHAGMGKVEAAYNRSVLIDRRRTVFDRWSALLKG